MPLEPNEKARLYDTAAQTADTDVLGSDVTPSESPAVFQVTVQVASDSTVSVIEDVGGTTKSQTLNDGTALTGGNLYSFDVPVRDAGSYNIQLGSGVVIDVLNIDEKPLGVV